MGRESSTLAGGCFWCTEAILKRLDGVISVQPGFSGGHTENPKWPEVCSGSTGHAECVQIQFDTDRISFREILEVFFRTHDPTTPNQQGHDKGTAYRSVIFYHNQAQRTIAEEVKSHLQRGCFKEARIVTEIEPIRIFYPAERFHQDFYESGHRPDYCFYIIDPKLRRLEELFNDKLKKDFQSPSKSN